MSGDYIVITGLSGAGRSQAADDLEDLGWFVIDNLPPSLIPKVAELVQAPGSSIERVALAVGASATGEVIDAIDELRSTGERVRVLFLDASTDVLVRRYEGTRRRHPLSAADSLAEAIDRERAVLEPVRAAADVVVDTSDLNVHELRQRVVALFGSEGADAGMQTTVLSFGYKYGLPVDVDLVLDCRFLPNPHWVDELRPLTGSDAKVRRYVLKQPGARDFIAKLEDLLALILPAYVAEGKSYLTIALGCTGGRHRSVVMAEEIGKVLRRHGFKPSVIHRDIEK